MNENAKIKEIASWSIKVRRHKIAILEKEKKTKAA
jgi:hypothetical protein